MASSSSSPVTVKADGEIPTGRSIEFVEEPFVFTFTIPDDESTEPAPRIVPSRAPKRSILKHTAPVSPGPEKLSRRVTPFPEDPLANSQFLEYPVSVILSATSTLQELIDAYSLLTARIRSSIPPGFGNGIEDSNRPLFFPLRRQSSELTEVIVRDLSRVLIDPRTSGTPATESPSAITHQTPPGLPSPRKTPTKSPKKGGMTEEQVKLGRDVCIVTASAFKFLCLAFALPAVYEVFSSDQLSSILTAALAIPLKESLPTPNARKTYTFALGFLQQQRLPAAVLTAAKDRIIFAIRRAIAGEFGREGKKGSVGDGLRAIHDFCSLHPRVFLPGFADMLQPILDTLLSPILPLRITAAHALGGIVLGITSDEKHSESIFERIAPVLTEFMLGKDAENGRAPPAPIVISLRTALKCTEMASHAQGPYWALCVIASLIVLCGPALHTNGRLMCIFYSLIQTGIKPRKKMIRAMTSTLFGPLLWNWRKWNDVYIPDANSDDEYVRNWDQARSMFWKTLQINAQLPTGHAFFASILQGSDDKCTKDDLMLFFHEIGTLVKHGGDTTITMLDMLERLLTPPSKAFPSNQWERDFKAKLIPHALFSISPGLLTSDGNALVHTVEYIMSELPELEDVRPLSEKEKKRVATWANCKDIWLDSFKHLTLEVDETIPAIFLDLWCQIINTRLLTCNTVADRGNCAEECAIILTEILSDKDIDLRVPGPSTSNSTSATSAALALKLGLVRQLWIAANDTIPAPSTRQAFAPMFRYLLQHISELVPSDDHDGRALSHYAMLAAQVAMVGAPSVVRKFFVSKAARAWNTAQRSCAWRAFGNAWKEDNRGSWKGAAALLGVPFDENGYWMMSKWDHNEWMGLVRYAMEKGDNEGVPIPGVLDEVAMNIERLYLPSLPTATQLADDLLSSLNKTLQDTRVFPSMLFDLVQDIMRVTYPPEENIKIVSQWMVRSLQHIIDACPSSMVSMLLESVQDGVCRWLSDECGVFTDEEYSRDIVPLYQTILLSLQSLRPSNMILRSLSPLILSGISSTISPESESLLAFEDFWTIFSSDIVKPREGWPEGIEDALAKLHSHRGWPSSSSSDDLSSEYFDAEESPEMELSSDFSPEEEEADELDVISSSPLQRKSMRLSLEAKRKNALKTVQVIDVDAEEDESRMRTTLSSSPVIATPKRRPTKISVARPEKLAQSRLILQSPSTPSKKKQTAGRRSLAGSCADDDEEKENSPTRRLDVALSVKKSAPDCVLGKRRISGTPGGPLNKKPRTMTDYALSAVRRVVSVHQKRRAEMLSSDDSEAECSMVEEALVVDPSQDDSSSSPESTPSKSPKRARSREMLSVERHEALPTKVFRRQDDLPSSSDDESSPVGPNTPRQLLPSPRVPSKARLSLSPPSDDSIMSDSPTRDHVARRLQHSSLFNRMATLSSSSTLKTYSKKSPVEAALPSSPARASIR